MSLTKIPLILLATWAMYVTYTPPNPPPPQQERFPPSMSVPLELGVVKWVPTIGRVSNYSKAILAENFTS